MKPGRRRTNPPPAPDWVYFGARRLLVWLARIFIRLEVRGRENVPADDVTYLTVVNHLSFFDTILLCVALPHRALALGADKYRRVPVISHVLEMMGVIWVSRGEADLDAIKAAVQALRGGRRMGLAPEGTRSRVTRALQPGKSGAAYLADRAGVPVLPVAMAYTDQIIPNWQRLRRPYVLCVIGQPFRLPGNGRAKGAALDALTDLIMVNIARLLPERYRGVYADHPLLKDLEAQPGAAAGGQEEAGVRNDRSV